MQPMLNEPINPAHHPVHTPLSGLWALERAQPSLAHSRKILPHSQGSGWTSLPTDKQLCPQIPKVLTVTFIRHVEVFPCPPHHSLQDRPTLMCLRGASSSTFSGCRPPGLLSAGLGAHSEPGYGGSPQAHHPSLRHPGRLSGAEPLS